MTDLKTHSLHFRVQGQGPDVILLHGLFGDASNLNGIAKTLADNFRIWQLDLPNHGQSPHCDEMSYLHMAQCVEAFMAAQQLEKAHILGHSMGGKVAMTLALNHPELIDKLIVVDIAPVSYPARHQLIFDAFAQIKLSQLPDRNEALHQMLDYGIDLMTAQFLLKNLKKTADGFVWRHGLAQIKANYPMIIGWPETHTFQNPSYQRPCLFIRGNDSDYVTSAYKQAILSQFPQVTAKTILAAGHNVHVEKPIQFNRLVKQYLEA